MRTGRAGNQKINFSTLPEILILLKRIFSVFSINLLLLLPLNFLWAFEFGALYNLLLLLLPFVQLLDQGLFAFESAHVILPTTISLLKKLLIADHMVDWVPFNYIIFVWIRRSVSQRYFRSSLSLPSHPAAFIVCPSSAHKLLLLMPKYLMIDLDSSSHTFLTLALDSRLLLLLPSPHVDEFHCGDQSIYYYWFYY